MRTLLERSCLLECGEVLHERIVRRTGRLFGASTSFCCPFDALGLSSNQQASGLCTLFGILEERALGTRREVEDAAQRIGCGYRCVIERNAAPVNRIECREQLSAGRMTKSSREAAAEDR